MARDLLIMGRVMSQISNFSFKNQCIECLYAFWGDRPQKIKQGYECLYNKITPFIKHQFNNLQSDQQSDVVLNTLWKIHAKGKGSVIESCSSWVITIAKREAINILRKEARHIENRAKEERLGYEMPDNISVDEDFNKQLQLQAAIEKAIEFLKKDSGGKDDLEIITSLVNGESYEEISKKTGRTVGAVSTRASLIRKKLQFLKEDYED